MAATIVRRVRAALLRRRIARLLDRVQSADLVDPMQRTQARVWLSQAHTLQDRLSAIAGAQ